MHELSLAENMLELIEAVRERESFVRVRAVRMEIGRLSCVDPEALRFAFGSVSGGSCAEAAELDIEPVEGWGACPACGCESDIESLVEPCPECDFVPMRVMRGTEMRLRDMDVE